jgi:hypothetical protein
MSAPSQAEVLQLLISLLPAGSEQLYDLSASAYIGGLFQGLAGSLKETVLDRIEALRGEVNPSTLVELLPVWEQACGLAFTPIALFGTVAQRRDAVLAALRMSGSFSHDDIRAIVQPYFLYANAAEIEILETPRTAYITAHTYSNTTPVTTPAATPALSTVSVLDDPAVGQAGATAIVNLTTTRLDRQLFALRGPDGFRVFFGLGWLSQEASSVTNQTYFLFAPRFARKAIRGTWTLEFHNLDVGSTVNSWGLFVEGQGVNFDRSVPPVRIGEGLGAGIFNFAVVADPAKLGTGFDLEGAQRALTRWKPAHTVGAIVQISPITSDVCAIPDTPNAIPNRALPC